MDDSGGVLGIEPDFGYLSQGKQNADGWMLSLKEAIINALEREVWSAIHASLVRHERQTRGCCPLSSPGKRDLAKTVPSASTSGRPTLRRN